MKVLLDSNFILVPIQFKVDIFHEILNLVGNAKICSLSACIGEAKNASKGKYKSFVDQLLELGKIKVIEAEGNVDQLLLEFGKRNYIIATNDRRLRKNLDQMGIKNIYLRQKRYLVKSNF